ncbi:hypothetical protein EDC94DRAFT_644103 [Helicostylum pulchrum]|nr:hypothetical protein EDC94DRAFT_644103 [Helicostylum pulchrum]
MDVDPPLINKDLEFDSVLDCSVVYKTSSIIYTLIAEETTRQDHLVLIEAVKYAVPYSVFDVRNRDVLLDLCGLINVRFETIFGKYADDIIFALLLEPDATKGYHSSVRLQVISGKPQIYKSLATAKAIKITTTLALDLGRPELKNESLWALNEMNLVCSTIMTLPQYLSHSTASVH